VKQTLNPDIQLLILMEGKIMNMQLPGAILIAACLSLVNCGGRESTEEQTGIAETDSSTVEKPAGASHIYAKEQQLLKDARAIQEMLDNDAGRKKEALKNLD
jgi:hypothetical protein